MKKLFLLLAAAAVSFAANAYTLNNPIGADGRYIVKYNCAEGQFAPANDFEIDETFVLALDVTGTWLADWLKDTPKAEGASRGVALNFWTSCGDVNFDVRRLKQLNGNIWGMTLNLAQIKNDAADFTNALMTDSVMYIYGQVFGFEYTADNAGAGWWMWGTANEGETTQADGSDCLFATLPYTGTKTSVELFNDDYSNGDIYGFGITGYAAPCMDGWTAVENVETAPKAAKVIEDGHLYLIKDGVRYNALGAVVK